MQKLHNIFQHTFDATYIKENGVTVIRQNDLKPFIPFETKDEMIVKIPSLQFGGNHTHPRQECWFGIGEKLELIWLDEHKNLQKVKMNEHKQLSLFLMPPNIAHTVINYGGNDAFLYEFADGPQVDVKQFDLISLLTK